MGTIVNLFETDFSVECLGNVQFLAIYYKKIKEAYNLPSNDLLSKIAYKTYENRENKGIMCFAQEASDTLKGAIRFSESSIDEEGFVEER